MTRSRGQRKFDPVRLDVFHHLFAAAAEEMGAALMRASFSPNIRERRDFSCALFDEQGRMIGQASHLPVHLGSTPMSVRAAIESVAMEPGDAVILNDPYSGGTHLPDITLVSPVYLSKGGVPDFYCANRAHHADVGGAHPGSMGPTLDVHGEGLRLPPVRLVRGGEIQRDVLALVLANMRVPEEREGDLLAQWSTNKIGARRLVEMAQEHGADEVHRRGAELMDWTERLTGELFASMPNGSWSFEDELETGVAGEPAYIRLRLEKGGRKLVCDFSATDRVPASPLNTTLAVTVSAVFYVVRALLPPGTPTNDGILRCLEVRTRAGTLVDASYPSGVAAGNVETSQRIVDTLLGALAQALPERIPAASSGTMSNLTFGGEGSRGPFVSYETIAGGAGAGPRRAGTSAVQTHMTNTRNTPIEELESVYPVRVLSLGVRRDSGGKGRRPGGDGMRKELLFTGPTHVAFVSERSRQGPWGLAGGGAGAPGRVRLRLPGARSAKPLPATFTRVLPAGSVLTLFTPGGGAHGRS